MMLVQMVIIKKRLKYLCKKKIDCQEYTHNPFSFKEDDNNIVQYVIWKEYKKVEFEPFQHAIFHRLAGQYEITIDAFIRKNKFDENK